jgi:hypothetical protein
VASSEDQGCADKRTDSRARQHETLLRNLGGTTGMIGASMRSDGSLVACVAPLSPGLPLSHTSKEVAILPCYFLKHPPLW